MNTKNIQNLIFGTSHVYLIFLFCVGLVHAQRVDVVDHLGNKSRTGTVVTESISTPTNSKQGDIWIDNSSTPKITKFWDGSSWTEVKPSYQSVLQDADADTKIQLEEATDDDTIRFDTGGVERMMIDSSGAMLVNTTSKSNSETRLAVWANSSLDSIPISIETRCKADVDYFALAAYRGNGQYVGGIKLNQSTNSISLTSASDKRLKKNIQDADDAGSKIDAIQVRQFDWKVNGSHQDYGVIAQELREVIPNAVHETPSPNEEKMLSVDYAGLVPMLIKEIQSLRNRVEELENN